MTKNIFVVGLDDFNRRPLERVRHADQYTFHRLLDYATATQPSSIDFEHLLAKAQDELRAFSGSIDAIVGFWDFPTTLMLPFLRSEYQLPGPSVEGVLRCEHKYWAREIQNRIEPDAVPQYAAINPFDDKQASTPPLNFPFWMKPIKAHSSQLGFRIDSQSDYEEAIQKTREKIEYFAANLNQIMKRAEVPASIAEIDGWHSIAEEIISDGRQCTLEGYVYEGEVVIYGVIDSLRGPNQSSLERYQYPSDVPQPIKARMIDVSSRVIQATQLDNSPFNIEFYWYPRQRPHLDSRNQRTDLKIPQSRFRKGRGHSPQRGDDRHRTGQAAGVSVKARKFSIRGKVYVATLRLRRTRARPPRTK